MADAADRILKAIGEGWKIRQIIMHPDDAQQLRKRFLDPLDPLGDTLQPCINLPPRDGIPVVVSPHAVKGDPTIQLDSPQGERAVEAN